MPPQKVEEEELKDFAKYPIVQAKLDSSAWVFYLEEKKMNCYDEILKRKKVKAGKTDSCYCDCGYTYHYSDIIVHSLKKIFTFIWLYLRLPVALCVFRIYFHLNRWGTWDSLRFFGFLEVTFLESRRDNTQCLYQQV